MLRSCWLSYMEEGCLWFYTVLQEAQADPTLAEELQSYKLEVIREAEESWSS